MTVWIRTLTLIAAVLLAGCANQAHTDYRGDNYRYSDAELDQMLAPIALYPDVVLSQILMATTFPDQVEEAAAWSYHNPNLSGSRAANAVAGYDWDPSVMSLVAFPELLQQLSDHPDWTWKIGDAYLYQEADVMDSIQRLRSHAYRAGHLDRLDHMNVYRDSGLYIIEPINPALIYLPYYRPLSVYGEWWWPGYDPFYWDSPYRYRSGLTFYWGSGIALSSGFFYSGFHWHQRHLVTFDRHYYYRDRSYGGHYYKHYKNTRRWDGHNERRARQYRLDNHYRRDGHYGNEWRPNGDYRHNPGIKYNDRDDRRQDSKRDYRDYPRMFERNEHQWQGDQQRPRNTRDDRKNPGARDHSSRDSSRNSYNNDNSHHNAPGHSDQYDRTKPDYRGSTPREKDRDRNQNKNSDHRPRAEKAQSYSRPGNNHKDAPFNGGSARPAPSYQRDSKHSDNYRESDQKASDNREETRYPNKAERQQNRTYTAPRYSPGENPRARFRDQGSSARPSTRSDGWRGHEHRD